MLPEVMRCIAYVLLLPGAGFQPPRSPIEQQIYWFSCRVLGFAQSIFGLYVVNWEPLMLH